MVIDRWECAALKRGSEWLLVYGRRKTGKTFLLRRCLRWGLYVTITRARSCIVERGGSIGFLDDLRACISSVIDSLARGETVVVDEFQRLPEDYWDLIALKRSEVSGRLVLCGSSLGIARRVFDRRSPLLGLLQPFLVGLASVADSIASLSKHLPPREAVLWGALARDPWILGLAEPRGEPWIELARRAPSLAPVATSLIGEVFTEEEKQLTRLYEATLRLLAEGYWSSKSLAQKLFEARLISAPHPGIVTGILSQLESMGLVAKIPLWRTRGARYFYRHSSPLLSTLLRIDELVEEHGASPDPQQLAVYIAIELQFAIGELLAQKHNLVQAYTILPHGEGDIDIVLLDRRRRPVAAYEVKAGDMSSAEARRAVERIRSIGIPRAGIVCLGSEPPQGVADEAYSARDIVEVAKEVSARLRECSG
ncbi:MAG: ATP-binding protein [Crenarchaeota archaeon]|nr:ATP-binding protein [Thermoproteota archaeon]